MNDNEGTIPQQIARLDGIAATMRDVAPWYPDLVERLATPT
jgi:hypothetical protein